MKRADGRIRGRGGVGGIKLLSVAGLLPNG